MKRTPLATGWTVQATNDPTGTAPGLGTVAATVPGTVHLDLLAAGLIEDPFRDAVADDLQSMFGLDWRYDTVLDPGVVDLSPASAAERVELVFDGIDTVAVVRLGGTELGRTANMHRSHRFDVTTHLTGRPLELTVDLESATRHAEGERARLGDRPAAYEPPYNFVRKMASSFGWDWGPDLRTAGLWKPVRLERWRTARFAQVRPLVTVEAGVGRVVMHVELARAADATLTVSAALLGRQVEVAVPAGGVEAVVELTVPDPPLWWPAGYGEQAMADLDLRLLADGEELDRWSRRVGFRTLRVDTTPDAYGTPYVLVVNDQPVFVLGVNWIPDDHFLTRVTAARVGRRLDQAVAAHANLVRVWGGGVFESDDFYAACDERGLLVWQDFLLACGAYAEEEPLWSEVEAETRENVVRLMSHPALAVYCGGNENLWGHTDWGWSAELAGRSWGERYAREMFPAIVAELDPTRPYADNSPFSPAGAPAGVHPNDPDHGTHHQWEVWNRLDWSHYRAEIPRFCAEFGFQAPPTWRTLTESVHAADGRPLAEAADPKNDPVFLRHQKAADGNAKLDRGMAPYVGVPDDFADWHWAAQLIQGRAIAYAIDHYRSHWPRTAGAVVWQLNDCWPVTSWAAIDYGERRKPLWYALRAAFSPHRLVFGERDGGLTVTAVNDTDQVWSGELGLRRETFDGHRRAEQAVPVDVPPRSVASVPVHPGLLDADDPAYECVVAELGATVAVHTFRPDRELRLDPWPLRVAVEVVPDGYLVRVEAHSLTRDLTLCVDRLAADAEVDDAMLTLTAGNTATFRVTTAARDLAEQLGSAPVLRTANDLVGG